MKRKVDISSLHDVNMDHYRFPRQSGLTREHFEQTWRDHLRNASADTWIFWLCLLGIIVAFIVADRPL